MPDTTMPAAGPAFPIGLADAPGRHARLRRLLTGPDLFVAPGAFDCVSARLVEAAGFGALYITGSGVSMSALGAPDVAALSFGEILDRVKRICDVVSIPVIADGDTGYGGPLNIIRTVREFERAGVSAIQIEDQEWPKKCGHEPGRRLVSVETMVMRIRAATEARRDEDFAVIARTDARSTDGLDAALERARAFREAGADVIFVESPQSEAELEAIGRALPGMPLLANMVEGGKTPILPAGRLQELGFRLAIYPNALTRLFAKAGLEMLASLRETGSTAAMADRMLDHGALWTLFDNATWRALENRYLDTSATA
ncbi:Carboxyvinyl-carboxyphosphonate phosphorylmutase (plasmid) [Roseomonas mucosa]|uniref:isocitrate lyase/PEP mutase family protein n=1 Tax=Roseomonas mucosa TaxID=207340 RepID=UPI0022069DD0|nr:oxaloacetate decarboxylase [Roseomonas mucosa]QDJ11591.1 Carboxyvinyl-carboxyphosphonate phosphorylmutase [Roseomonas mucosa]